MPIAAGGTALLDPEFLLKDELGVHNGSIVGDLGCGGAGYFVFVAARLVGEGVVYAIDVQRSVLDNIESHKKLERLENITTLWANLEVFGGTPINNNTLDYAVLSNVLFQNSHRQEIIRESSRVLKSGGRLLVIEWNEGRMTIGPAPRSKVSQDEVVKLCAHAGLKEVKRFAAGRWHYGIIFEK